MFCGVDWVGRDDRHPVEIDAVVQRGDGSEVAIRLTDFSREGCRIEAPGDDLLIGERLHLVIPGIGTVAAQVRWALPGCAGARFVEDPAG